MAIEVTTKDCSALADADFEEMSEVSTAHDTLEAGLLSKQAEKWVLNTQARREGELQGFAYSSLERIGGTPALVLGAVVVDSGQRSVVQALLHEQFHKARMAFPDEDVIVAARMLSEAPLQVLDQLEGLRPWPTPRLNGEERAWGRRLSARFGTDTYDDRTMVATAEGTRMVFDYVPAEDGDSERDEEIVDQFSACSEESTFVIGWGWAMAEFLDDFQTPAS